MIVHFFRFRCKQNYFSGITSAWHFFFIFGVNKGVLTKLRQFGIFSAFGVNEAVLAEY